MITVEDCNMYRSDVKAVAERLAGLRIIGSKNSEAMANITLAYRHLEDASMRLGKVIQALNGGVSVYDKSTAVMS